MLITIVWRPSSLVSERVGIIRISSSTKPNSRVTGIAVVLFITNATYSGFGKASALTVEPFLVTLGLQGGIGTNQKLPCTWHDPVKWREIVRQQSKNTGNWRSC